MRLSDLKEKLGSDPEVVEQALEALHPEDVAEMLRGLPEDEAIEIVIALQEEFAALVLERLSVERQVRVVEEMGEASAGLLSEMAPDDAADLIQELPEAKAEQILAALESEAPDAGEEMRELLAYPPDSAGGLMTTEFVGSPPDTKVWQAMQAIREQGHRDRAETISYVYVLAYGDKLVGVVSLRELILADPGQTLEEIMSESVIRVSPLDPQNEVAALFARYDLNAIPVVDERGEMLGLVTVDDAMDVVIDEATAEAQQMGGVAPLEDSYFDTGFVTFIRKRVGWLTVLFFGSLLTASVLEHHAATMDAIPGLILFIPMIIASGGNAGSQSSSLIIRAIAVGEVKPRDWMRIASRELGIGVALGLVLGVLAFVRVFVLGHPLRALEIATVVSASTVFVVVAGALIGSLLPLGIKRIGLDPAVSSTPFVASLIDVVGLLIYFTAARFILGAVL